eukprot:gene3895-2764_t
MKFYVEEVLVVFPYDYIYPEQLEYITELKRTLDTGGHMVLEMPSGTGKTISLLSILVAYLHHHAHEQRKVVYCTRTVEEMTKTMGEMRKLFHQWELECPEKVPLTGVCLSAKKNMCIEPQVASLINGDDIDAGCRALTAPWEGTRRCAYYDTLEVKKFAPPPGVYALNDLKKLGETHNVCPYYYVRTVLPVVDILVHSYMYIVDPVVAEVTRDVLNEKTIVVLDEAHNVDDVCIEALSVLITKKDASEARQNIIQLRRKIDEMKATNRQQLEEEYNQLIRGLTSSAAPATRAQGDDHGTTTAGAAPPAASIPEELLTAAMPGEIVAADRFVDFLQRLADFNHRIVTRVTRTYVADPLTFLTKVQEECSLEVKHFVYLSERMKILLTTLQVSDAGNFRPVSLLAHMFTLLATYYKDERYEKPGFVVVCEAQDPSRPGIPDPVIRTVCVDASLALKDTFAKYRNVVLTSGTLSPLDIYPKILGFTPALTKSFRMTLSRKCIAPVIVTRSSESVSLTSEELTSSFKVRKNLEAQTLVTSAYESLLMKLAQTVPDGIVCFFTGYQYMGEILLAWHSSGFLQELAKHKLIFVETQGVEETSIALANYRRACDIGRGAIFMSIARGKIAEGIDFDRHYGRAVIMFGVPFLPPNDEPLRQRMHWMEVCLGISETEFRNFDAMRQASQCIGRVLRNKTDFGMMLLVDRRYALKDKIKKIPSWIQQNLKENTNLSVDAAIEVARTFFKDMAQPWEREKDLGTTLYSRDVLAKMDLLTPRPPTHDPNSEILQQIADADAECATHQELTGDDENRQAIRPAYRVKPISLEEKVMMRHDGDEYEKTHKQEIELLLLPTLLCRQDPRVENRQQVLFNVRSIVPFSSPTPTFPTPTRPEPRMEYLPIKVIEILVSDAAVEVMTAVQDGGETHPTTASLEASARLHSSGRRMGRGCVALVLISFVCQYAAYFRVLHPTWDGPTASFQCSPADTLMDGLMYAVCRSVMQCDAAPGGDVLVPSIPREVHRDKTKSVRVVLANSIACRWSDTIFLVLWALFLVMYLRVVLSTPVSRNDCEKDRQHRNKGPVVTEQGSSSRVGKQSSDAASAPSASSWCAHCESYISAKDHHCYVVCNCIGDRNRIAYIQLLALAVIELAFLNVWGLRYWAYVATPGPLLAFGLLLALVADVLLALLLAFHLFLLWKGWTTRYFFWMILRLMLFSILLRTEVAGSFVCLLLSPFARTEANSSKLFLCGSCFRESIMN